jgi:hypothetical protein
MRISIMRVASRPVAIFVLAVGLLLGAAGRAEAGPLNPLDFASLGAFPTATGQYTINTSGAPSLAEPNGTIITGVVFNGIAVFDFDSINVLGNGPNLPPLQSFIATGSLPLALLSRTDATIAGLIDGSGQVTATGIPPFVHGGPGGGSGGAPFGGFPGGGPGGGTAGQLVPNVGGSGGGGGGFGGPGGNGGPSIGAPSVPGGLGGATYGDLSQHLQGGSGGGGAANFGAGGGGAIEIGAVGSLTISGFGSILANGASSVSGIETGFGGGGGSGGGIFLHADSVLLAGTLSAAGGDGGAGGIFPGPGNVFTNSGGGGGGGEVTILFGTGGFTETNGATIDVAGGAGINPGGAGFINIVPEPASLVLMCTGLLGTLGYAWLRRNGPAA